MSSIFDLKYERKLGEWRALMVRTFGDEGTHPGQPLDEFVLALDGRFGRAPTGELLHVTAFRCEDGCVHMRITPVKGEEC